MRREIHAPDKPIQNEFVGARDVQPLKAEAALLLAVCRQRRCDTKHLAESSAG